MAIAFGFWHCACAFLSPLCFTQDNTVTVHNRAHKRSLTHNFRFAASSSSSSNASSCIRLLTIIPFGNSHSNCNAICNRTPLVMIATRSAVIVLCLLLVLRLQTLIHAELGRSRLALGRSLGQWQSSL